MLLAGGAGEEEQEHIHTIKVMFVWRFILLQRIVVVIGGGGVG